MEDNIGAEVYSKNDEVIKELRAPAFNEFPNTEDEEKELFDYYKEQVRLDKKIDINEVDKIVCYSLIKPNELIIFRKNKSGWEKEIREK
jgi:hypothetical protein